MKGLAILFALLLLGFTACTTTYVEFEMDDTTKETHFGDCQQLCYDKGYEWHGTQWQQPWITEEGKQEGGFFCTCEK
jgi:hypothetical protein